MVIQQCPIDVRRGLYENIVLSGGSTMFKDFARRMQRDIKRISDARLALSEELSRGRLKVYILFFFYEFNLSVSRRWPIFFVFQPKPIEVQVVSHKMQRYAVWFGGSMLGSTVRFFCSSLLTRAHFLLFFFQSEFYQVAHTKAEYMEKGPSICRHNAVFGALT